MHQAAALSGHSTYPDPDRPVQSADVSYELAGFDHSTAAPDQLLNALSDTARAIAWLQAREVELIAEFAAREPEIPAPAGMSPLAPAALEVGSVLKWSPRAAETKVRDAVTLCASLPLTLGALRTGRIDAAKARAIIDAVSLLDEDATAALERRVLPRAEFQTLAQLRACLRRAVIALGPTAADRVAEAQRSRHVTITPTDDGMAELWALLSASDAAAINTVLNQAAGRKEGRDPRTTDQRRADAFVQLLAGTPESRPRPQLHLTVSITSLLGLDREPADLSGCGPIPADLAKELAKDATWRRILTDPAAGTVLDVGRTRYAPPADLDRFVRVRDGYCRFPGCRRRATGCDLDHTVRFPDGPTAAANLAALCRRHHRFKHESGWSVQPDQGRAGGLQWVSPRGARYRTEPPPPGEESSTMRIRPHPEDPLGDELLEVAWQSTLLAGPPN